MIWTTATDIASLFHVPRGTVHRWANEDDWPRIGHGKRVAYEHERAIESYARRRHPNALTSTEAIECYAHATRAVRLP